MGYAYSTYLSNQGGFYLGTMLLTPNFFETNSIFHFFKPICEYFLLLTSRRQRWGPICTSPLFRVLKYPSVFAVFPFI